MRKNGRKSDAVNAYKKAVDLADDVPTMILVAEVLQSEQRFDESEKVLRRAVSLDTTNPIALYLLGRALIVKKNHVEAESVLLRSVGISPRTFAPLWDLGSLYVRAGRFTEAEKIYLKALPLASEVERKQIAGVSGLTGIGDGYIRRNQKTDALRVYRKARELDGDNKQLVAKISAASK
jgi:cytochrome c-type biogenesis protein CcmH/NrfG